MRTDTQTTITIGVILLVLSLALGMPSAFAAGNPGTLIGKTVSFDGKAVKKVSITLTSPDDPEFVVETTSDRNGDFVITVDNAELTHEITFEKRGFVVMKTTVYIEPGQENDHVFTMLTQNDVNLGRADIVRQREIEAAAQPAIDLFNEGVGAFQSGDLDSARTYFEEALEIDDSLAPALSALSVVAMEQEDWVAAAGAAERALAAEPTDTKALIASHRANSALGNDGLAAQAAASLMASGGNVEAAGVVFNQAVDAYRAQDVATATALFEEAVLFDPTLVDAQAALAAIYLSERRFDEADAAAEAALEIDPENDRALKVRFETALVQGNDTLPAAAAGLGAVDPGYVSKRINERASDLFKANRIDDAKQLTDMLLAIDPDDARANYTFGLILVNEGDTAAGREHLERFLELAPGDPDAEGARAMLGALQ